MNQRRDGGARAAWPWARILSALVHAPVVLAIFLTVPVLMLAGSTEGTLWAAVERAGTAAVIFTTALIVFSMTFGALGVFCLVLTGQQTIVAWALMGGILGIVAAMAHGVLIMGVVVGGEMTASTLLGALLFVMIRRFSGVGRYRPS